MSAVLKLVLSDEKAVGGPPLGGRGCIANKVKPVEGPVTDPLSIWLVDRDGPHRHWGCALEDTVLK